MSAVQAVPQNYTNHGRIDPFYHFVLAPILLFNFGFSIYATIHHWPSQADLFLWWIVMSFALLILAAKTRTYALKVQDRVIRLEERLRLADLLPATDRALIAELSPAQLVALRFASDEELPALTRRTLAEGLAPKAIKQSITHWRSDTLRV
jgi:hypothetical protein